MKLTTIIKRDGRKVSYRRENVAIAIWKALFAVRQVKGLELAQQAAELTVEESCLKKKSSEWKEAKRLSEIVERILIRSNGTHRWTVEEMQDVVEQVLLAAGHEDAAKAYILYRNRQAITRSSKIQALKSKEDDRLGMSENAYAAIARRYLWKDKEGNFTETPRQAMIRVATVVASIEDGPSRTGRTVLSKKWENKYLDIMTSFEFVPAGCYFRGAGNAQNGSLANCFVLPVEDSIEKIFDAVKWSALIHTLGGGTGFNFSHIRPRGDVVGHGGLAAGPINFMKAFNAETQIVMQGGTHRGANMGILNADHPDILDFIVAKATDGDITNFNVSVGAFDRFMKAVQKDAEWELVNPKDKSVIQKIPASNLWNQLITMAWKTGDPGMIYLDAINRANPVLKALGPIESTNVCGEQPLHPFDVCNLGSINLSKFVVKPWWQNPTRSFAHAQNDINWSRLEYVVRTAVRFLDNGVDASTYPIPQITDMAHKLRRIGLGVMGWADMLAQLGVRYDSDDGVKISESIMKFIQSIGWDESERLAKEKSTFPLWNGSYFNTDKNPFGKRKKVRNVAVTTIAPTGTISMIADCSSGIEPYFALEYTKNVVEKEGLKYTNKYYEEAKKVVEERLKGQKAKGDLAFQPSGLSAFLSSVFHTAHEISPEWHIRMQAAFQKYTDNAVSKTINFAHTATVEDVEKAYFLAWKLGCKGITVYRDGSKEHQILSTGGLSSQAQTEGRHVTSNNSEEKQQVMQSQIRITPLSQRAYQVERREIAEDAADGHCPECGVKMEMTEGCSICRSCGYSKCSI